MGRRGKRKLIVDKDKEISNVEMRMQISDSSDTMVTAPTMAPSTKRIMHWRKNGGVERILGVPGKQHNSHALLDEYKGGLTSKATTNEYFGMLGDYETEKIELIYAPGEKELLNVLAVRGKPGRKRVRPYSVKTEPSSLESEKDLGRLSSVSNEVKSCSDLDPNQIKSELFENAADTPAPVGSLTEPRKDREGGMVSAMELHVSAELHFSQAVNENTHIKGKHPYNLDTANKENMLIIRNG